MKQNHFARKKRQLAILAEKLHFLLIYHKDTASKQIEILIQKIRRLVNDLAHLISGNELKKILGATALILGLSFSHQLTAQSFAFPQMNPFGLVSVYSHAAPAFADLDADGDLDLLIGEYYGTMQYFENIESANVPQFAPPQLNPFGIITASDLAFPEFVDLDNDGDMDLLVGQYHGDMMYFENTGSPINPQFSTPVINPYGLVPTNNHAIPDFADLDDDGDLDLLVGEYDGGMRFFENTGSAINPQFSAPLINPFGIDSTYVLASPDFADLDGDGDFDLLVGEYYGGLQYFENIGTSENPLFSGPQMNPFGLISTYYLAFPEFADLDDDGDMDLLVGEYYGAMEYFENTGISGIDMLADKSNFMVYPNPSSDFINIKTDQKIEKVEIYNLLGEMMLMVNGSNDRISLNNLKTGIYTVQVTFVNGGFAVSKIQKQ